MRVIGRVGREDIAMVYIGVTEKGKVVEFVESIQPPLTREKKWVLIVSTLYGCPVKCRICDASIYYKGKLTSNEILAQIDYMVRNRFQDGLIEVEKLKIQFARMGEPSFNEHVLNVLELLPNKYKLKGELIPSLSTIAPRGREKFFESLLEIKKRLFDHNFQLQFSIHSTDEKFRDWLIPFPKWSFKEIANYGIRFFSYYGRKITLNFALLENAPLVPQILSDYFDPEKFLIKITPVNPTYKVIHGGFSSYIKEDGFSHYEIVEELEKIGYQVIISIGELEENKIGSNCGQYITSYAGDTSLSSCKSYTYKVEILDEKF